MKQLIPLLILIVFLGILAGADIYLSRRFAFYFGLSNPKPLYFVFGAILFFMTFGMFGMMNTSSQIGTLLFQTASITAGFMIYLLLGVMVVDLFS